MTLKSQIQTDITNYMKAKAPFERDTLRLVLGEIQSAEKSGKTPKDFSDLETEAFLAKQVKTRRESARIYTEAGEADRATKETAEADLIATYLPEALDEAAVQAIVASAVASFDNPTRKEMGQIMKLVNAEVKGRFDGKAISQMVVTSLS
jgi:uncharacterized protein YqeY